MSRQADYQRANQTAGLCKMCKTERAPGSKSVCMKHLILNRLRARAVKGYKPWVPGGPGRKPIEDTP